MARVIDETERGNLLHALTGRPLLPPDAAYKITKLLIQSSARDFFGQGVRRAATTLGTTHFGCPSTNYSGLPPRGQQTQIAALFQEAMTIQFGF